MGGKTPLVVRRRGSGFEFGAITDAEEIDEARSDQEEELKLRKDKQAYPCLNCLEKLGKPLYTF